MRSGRANRLRAELDSLKKEVGAGSMVFEFENGQKLAVPITMRLGLKLMCCAMDRGHRIIFGNPEDPARAHESDPDFQRLLPLFKRAIRVIDRSGEHGFAGTTHYIVKKAEEVLAHPELKPNIVE